MGPEAIQLIFIGLRLAERGIALAQQAQQMSEDEAKAKRLQVEAETDALMERLRRH